ncbi:GDSL-type esterase/lipase family protein [Auritidibacter ignavus]|uniref:GDSL-type esterase/lipase family protein n=1 Tax=Auritidibacter ignavus TaxID=678932 RepID=UPI00109C2556|nr:GDSL-type esterase/lipase family protein [Auritidibacter ignavus]
MEFRQIRLASVGGEHLAGLGDPRAMGWLGRVLAKSHHPDVLVESYVLAAPQEPIEAMSYRWEEEALPRFSNDTENRLLIALNSSDTKYVPTSARARLNLANIIDKATQQGLEVFVVGPLPGLDQDANQKLRELNAAYRNVAQRRNVFYVDVFEALVDHTQYQQDLASNQGLPGQSAYGLVAWLVLHRGWYRWMNLPENLGSQS